MEKRTGRRETREAKGEKHDDSETHPNDADVKCEVHMNACTHALKKHPSKTLDMTMME